MTLADSVWHALRAMRRRVSQTKASKKLEVVRAASAHGFPTADIQQMLAEIERGRAEGRLSQSTSAVPRGD
jgi:hypothetical protein